MTKYYSFNDDESVTLIGEFDNVTAAFEAAPGNSVWVFDRAGLFALKDAIQAQLEDGK